MAGKLTPTKRLRAGSRRDPRTHFASAVLNPAKGDPTRPGKTADDSRPVHERSRVRYAALAHEPGQARRNYLRSLGISEAVLPKLMLRIGELPQRRFPTIPNPAVIRL